MRVLHWVYPFSPGRGGQSIFIERIALGFADRGHEVALALEPQSDSDMASLEKIFGSKVKRFHINLDDLKQKKAVGVGLFRVAAVIDEFKPDVIHIHNLKSRGLVYLRFYLTVKGRNIRTICTMHDLVTLNQVVSLLHSKTLVQQLNMVVAPSQFMFAKLGEIEADVIERFSLISNGVPEVPARQGLTSRPITLLFAAELNEHNGGVYLFNAWAKIFRNHPHVRLIVAGEGDAKDFLIQLARTLEFDSQVDFVGWLSQVELQNLFADDCILVMPSMIGEAFGLIAAEAAMAGIPVIAHEIGALPEIVTDGITGITVQAGHTQELADAMARLITDPALRRQMGESAHAKATSEFSMQTCINKYESLILKMNH